MIRCINGGRNIIDDATHCHVPCGLSNWRVWPNERRTWKCIYRADRGATAGRRCHRRLPPSLPFFAINYYLLLLIFIYCWKRNSWSKMRINYCIHGKSTLARDATRHYNLNNVLGELGCSAFKQNEKKKRTKIAAYPSKAIDWWRTSHSTERVRALS